MDKYIELFNKINVCLARIEKLMKAIVDVYERGAENDK